MIFFRSSVLPENNNHIGFEAVENELISGKCTLEINGRKAVITSLTFNENKPYICEGLIKSAFNYASLKNCYIGYVDVNRKMPLLEAMNFQKDGDVYFNDIPSIFMGNCCKK